MSNNQPIKLREAVKRMRALSELNIPFSVGFYKCNTTSGAISVYRTVDKAIIRQGYRDNQSNKANVFIAYVDCDDAATDKNRQFYLPLLMKFNGFKVIP